MAVLCKDIERAVNQKQLPPFSPDELPWSTQTLFELLEIRFKAAGHGELPVKFDTFRKKLNRNHGWKGSAGYQDTAAAEQLKRVLKL